LFATSVLSIFLVPLVPDWMAVELPLPTGAELPTNVDDSMSNSVGLTSL